jgi:hypothetical protein
LANSRSAYTGKKAWTVKPSKLKAKVIDSLLYLGTLGGVTLVAVSLLSIQVSIGLFIFGMVLTPISVFYRDRRSSISTSVKVNPIRKYTLLLMSTLGAGSFSAGVIVLTLLRDVHNSAVYLIVGLVLSILSRYVLRKLTPMGILKDYLLHIAVFAGVYMTVLGIMLLTSHWLLSIILILVGILLTPSSLILREKALLRRRDRNLLRKFFSMLAVAVGIGCSIFGVVSLFHGDWLLSLVTIEGLLLILGGAILNENQSLISLKDIV